MTMLHHNPLNPFQAWKDLDMLLERTRPRPAWRPAFDVEETEKAYRLRADLPGMAQKDIEVRVEDGLLSVKGERTTAGKTNTTTALRLERPAGKFARAYRLPEDADADAIRANYEAGVLELTIPRRKPEDTSRVIPVN
ncbi:MAG: Hsp20/alpha crystallin family protein [Bryobacterales bacterium]|nr:Hsp20/alpha crystallin family protein [Bryobacterales bacterium]